MKFVQNLENVNRLAERGILKRMFLAAKRK